MKSHRISSPSHHAATFSLTLPENLGGLGGEGEGAELPQPQPQPHGGRDPPRFCDPYRRSGLLPLWGSRIGGVQVTIFDWGVQSNVVRGVRALGHGRVARERGHSCQLPGAFVSGYCSTPPRCRGHSCQLQKAHSLLLDLTGAGRWFAYSTASLRGATSDPLIAILL